jgi:septal ring factor EnvC (AmiA/AmiB activator)
MGRRTLIVSVLCLLTGVSSVVAETNSAHPPATVVLDIADLVTFIKCAVWAGGLFLAALAILGVTFFGFDVRKARASIQDELSDLRKIIEDARSLRSDIEKSQSDQNKVQRELIDIKDRFEKAAEDSEQRVKELGAKIEELTDQHEPKEQIPRTDSPAGRTTQNLIREIIQSSRFEWTTMSRLMKRTGLSREDVLATVRMMPDIRIGFGRESQDNIFRFKRESEKITAN